MGYYVIFEVSKHVFRNEMQTKIQQPSSQLTMLKIVNVDGDREFQRIDKKEFRFKGRLYDIVREIKTGETTLFICLHDKKESNLFASLKRVNQNKNLFAIWEQVVMIFSSQPCFDLNPSFTKTVIFPRIDITLKSPMLPTWSPPPEVS